jgi:hypothetical protein
MPCRYWDDSLEMGRLRKNKAFLEAALCAILTAKDLWYNYNDILDDIDYDEAGISKQELMDWWENHKKNDAVRREKEEKEKEEIRKFNLRVIALSKLTMEEREALGL